MNLHSVLVGLDTAKPKSYERRDFGHFPDREISKHSAKGMRTNPASTLRKP